MHLSISPLPLIHSQVGVLKSPGSVFDIIHKIALIKSFLIGEPAFPMHLSNFPLSNVFVVPLPSESPFSIKHAVLELAFIAISIQKSENSMAMLFALIELTSID